MSKTRNICHIVFSTKKRMHTIDLKHKRELYAYIMGIIYNKKCTLIRINGMQDHVHILVDVHSSVSLSELVKSIKQGSSIWLKENEHFPSFDGWTEGYFAVSVGSDDVEKCRDYIINQEIHHSGTGYDDEMKELANYNGLTWDE